MSGSDEWIRNARKLACKTEDCNPEKEVVIYRHTETSGRIGFHARCAKCGRYIRRLQSASYYKDLLAGRDSYQGTEVALADIHDRYLHDPEFRAAVEKLDEMTPGYSHMELRDVARAAAFKRGYWKEVGSRARRLEEVYGSKSLTLGPGREGGT